jgi:biotin/methionine sulfoxide reductase
MTKEYKTRLTSSHWGTYRVQTENGRITDLINFEYDSDPSPIGKGIIDTYDDKSRISSPMIRKSWLEKGAKSDKNLRGKDPFVRVEWDEASEIVANELKRVIETYGNEGIFGGSYGWASAGRFHHAQSQLHRFLNCIGGYTSSKYTYSFAAAEAVVPHILGSFRDFLDTCTSWESINKNTTLFVCFGGIPLKNGQISQGGTGNHYQKQHLNDAINSGIKFINISPIREDLISESSFDWHPIKPNTDTALMIGLAHTLFKTNLYDKVFIDKYTKGFEKFVPYLLGLDDGVVKSARWASRITGLKESNIVSLAKEMAKNRTMISLSWSLTRQKHGEQPMWAGIMLASMLGQIGLPGGGFGFGYSATNYIGGNFTVIPCKSLPQGKNKVGAFIPVARITDMLLHPGEKFKFNGGDYHYPDIKLMYWAGGNPFHHHQDINRLLQGWKNLDTIITNEWCWNALAKYSDIVLPCTIPLEREDIAMTPRDPFLISMDKVLTPYKDSLDDYEIFSRVAEKMGIKSEFTDNKSSNEWQKWLYDETRKAASSSGIEMPSYEVFKSKGWFKVKPPSKPVIMMEKFRNDPENYPLKTPSGKIEIFSKTIAEFKYDDCPGHPIWLEPQEWLGSKNRQFPIHLISNQPKTKLHSQLDHGSHSRLYKIKGREPVRINPIDAKKRGIQNGEIVRLFNKRGSCLAGAIIDKNIRIGVAQMSTGAWYDPSRKTGNEFMCIHGNPNVLTPDFGTSKLGQGPIAHSCLIEIEVYKDVPEEINAFQPPTIN